MNRRISIAMLGILALGVCAISAKADALLGVANSHNGTTIPGFVIPGTGEVQVEFGYSGVTFGPHIADYYELATHQVEYAYTPAAEPAMLAKAFITNLTGVPWTGFRIRLEGADFAGWHPISLQAPPNDPVVDVGFDAPNSGYPSGEWIALQHWGLPGNEFSLSGSSITRSNNQGSGFLDAELLINLDSPLQPDRLFRLRYNIIPPAGDPGSTGFTAYLTPIPEPATAALLALAGLGCLAGRRRKG